MPSSSLLSLQSPSTATSIKNGRRILGANTDWMKVISQLQKRRHILISIAFISAIFIPVIAIQSLTNFTVSGNNAQGKKNLRSQVKMISEGESFYLGTYFEQRGDDISDIEVLLQRKLARSFVEEEDFEGFVMPEDLENRIGASNSANRRTYYNEENGSAHSETKESAIRPYNLTDVLYAADIYDSTFVTLVWDPDQDVFISYYSERHYWASSCEKLLASITSLTFMLKYLFPWRFQQGKSAEFAMAVSGGDYPGVKVTDCVLGRWSEPCARTAPILNFGSVFQRPIFPNMIAMPMPDVHHLRCFENWIRYMDVCSGLRRVENGGDLVFGESIGKSFEDLIPQVVWRGSEFGFLGKFFTDLKHPVYETHIEGNINPNTMKLKSAARVLRSMYGDLVPRWQGVVHTAEAEIEARRTQSLPWANIKFSHYMENGHKTEAVGSKGFEKWEEINFPAAGESMNLKELAHYKYHIDLGGGGGTTWSGTIIKLAMPGLLFHHVTPTKDYIHDRMKPWTHYIPVRADLRDLKSKFDWAESHPEIAAEIARQGTELARNLGTLEGFEQMFKEDFEEPMRQMIAAYQPSGQFNWRRVMKEVEGDLLQPIMACTVGGIHDRNHCQRLTGTEPFQGRGNRAPPRLL